MPLASRIRRAARSVAPRAPAPAPAQAAPALALPARRAATAPLPQCPRNRTPPRSASSTPTELLPVGRALHLEADAVEHPEQVEPRLPHRVGQRHGVRAVAPGAVERHGAGLRRVGDQRALRRLHLREPPPAARSRRRRTGCCGRHPGSPRSAWCRSPASAAARAPASTIGNPGPAAASAWRRPAPASSCRHLHAVPGVVEQRHVRALQRSPNLARRFRTRLVEIQLWHRRRPA